MGIGKIDPEYAVREGWARDSDDEIYMDGYNAFIQVTTRDGTSGFSIKNDLGAISFSSKSDGDGYVAKRLGIGTYNPETELEVIGKTRTDQLQVTTNAQSGYILTSDSSGNATWQESSGGGVSEQTFQENKEYWNSAIKYISDSCDGYHPDSTGQEHYQQHSDAIQTIIGELDGYSDIVRGHIYGLNIRYNSASQIKIETGTCSDDGYTYAIDNNSEITVDITASGVNGLDTGSESSSTWYYVWIIKNITTGAVRGLLSTSYSSPTMPSGYTVKRWIGSVRNDSSGDFLKVYMTGNGNVREYTYDDYTVTTVLNNGTAFSTWTDVDCSAFVPSTSTYLKAYVITVNVADTTCKIEFRPNGSTSSGQIALQGHIRTSGSIVCNTDSSQVIEYTNATTDTWSYMYTIGYKEEL